MSRWTARAGALGPRKTDVERPKDDFYPTPPAATEALLRGSPVLGRLCLPAIIWEPACGDGAISTVLASHGYGVVSSDISDHGYGETGIDFLAHPAMRGGARAIVTNPPFSLADQFAAHALDIGADIVALFLRLAFLEGLRRRSMFMQAPPERVLVFSDRVTLAPKGSGIVKGSPTAYAWFVWRRGYRGAPMIDWLVARDGALSPPCTAPGAPDSS